LEAVFLVEDISQDAVQGISDAFARVDSRKKRKGKILVVIAVIALLVIAALLIPFIIPQPPELVDICSNGVQDASEEGLDCGGACKACPVPEPPPYVDTAYVLPTSVSDVSIDLANDRIYVLDEMRHRIMVYDSEFNHIRNFGEERVKTDEGWSYSSGGLSNEQLLFPASIYLAGNKIYVLDRAPRIQVFSSDLVYEKTLEFSSEALAVLPKVPDTPNADGGMSSIAVSPDGKIFVAEEVSNSIAVFDSEMNLLNSITGPGEIDLPRQLAFSQGKVFVADSLNGQIRVFDSELNLEKSIGEKLVMPIGIAVAGDGRLVVLDGGDSRLKVLDSEGIFVKEIGGLGTGQGNFYNPKVAKFDSEGKIYVVEEGNARIQVFDSALKFVRSVEAINRTFNVSFTPFYPAISPNGDIAISDPINNKVFILDSEFELKQKIGGKGFGNTEFNAPKGIAFGTDGKLYVSDSGNRRVQVFSSDYSFNSSITNDKLIWPLAISVSEQNKIYVVDDKHKNILIFDQAGKLTGEIGEAQGITLPLGVLATGGKIYITDDKDQTIEIIGKSPSERRTITGVDEGVGVNTEFNESLGFDKDGKLMFCDNRFRKVVAVDLSTEEFSTFGSFGSGMQELSILEIASTPDLIVVADMESHEVKFFDADKKEIGKVGINDLN